MNEMWVSQAKVAARLNDERMLSCLLVALILRLVDSGPPVVLIKLTKGWILGDAYE